MAFGPIVSMEMDDDQKLDIAAYPGMAGAGLKPNYPCGLRLCLTPQDQEKLSLSEPKRQDLLDVRCFARVMAIREDGAAELQIEQMQVENENDETDEPSDEGDSRLADRKPFRPNRRR